MAIFHCYVVQVLMAVELIFSDIFHIIRFTISDHCKCEKLNDSCD